MYNFDPIHLAITLPKGFAKEYHDRDWFNSIYFSKLSMAQEKEGYIPILYDFKLNHKNNAEQVLPNKILMTFYYPEKKRLSNLSGIIIIGGHPDVYQAYQKTKQLTPHLESLLIEKYRISHDHTRQIIDETLSLLSNPKGLRSSKEILERSQGKSGEALATFFPILGDIDYQYQRLSLPFNFKIDAVFRIEISDEFFLADQPGGGVRSIQLYHRKNCENQITPSLAYPLIFKWQPIYNDILGQLKKHGEILPHNYEGELIPSMVIFRNKNDDTYSSLFSSINRIGDRLYYHAAVATSGYSKDGQPLSLLLASINREKFGTEQWMEKLEKRRLINTDSMRDRGFAEDLISSKLIEVVQETDVTTDGIFDLGKLRSIELEE